MRNRHKYHTAVQDHAVNKVVSADEELYMSEWTIYTNKKLKFLTTKTSQETQVYICFCIRTWRSVLARSFFAIIKRAADCPLSEFTNNRYWMSTMCRKYWNCAVWQSVHTHVMCQIHIQMSQCISVAIQLVSVQ